MTQQEEETSKMLTYIVDMAYSKEIETYLGCTVTELVYVNNTITMHRELYNMLVRMENETVTNNYRGVCQINNNTKFSIITNIVLEICKTNEIIYKDICSIPFGNIENNDGYDVCILLVKNGGLYMFVCNIWSSEGCNYQFSEKAMTVLFDSIPIHTI